jgi:hypothetical protein
MCTPNGFARFDGSKSSDATRIDTTASASGRSDVCDAHCSLDLR